MNTQVIINHELQDAINNQTPVVALESTVISHGLPYPDNLEVTHAMLSAIRNIGAVPAIIGVRHGKIKIGLSDDELDFFAKDKHILKLSQGDLAYCLSRKLNGATTVSASIWCAKLAGIKVFATGGIGGVHRQAETSFDISADLPALSKSPVLVVCSGAKAILDIPKTLEYLETLGVPVIGFGCETFPSFYSRQSSHKLAQVTHTVEEVAHIAHAHWAMGMMGLILANPIPKEYSLKPTEIEDFIKQAITESSTRNITGKSLTPFLLARLNELSHGKSLSANKALLVNNAMLAAQVAIRLRLCLAY